MAAKTTAKKVTKPSMVKVKLNCRYGKKTPNEIVTLNEDEAKRLLDLDVATKVEK